MKICCHLIKRRSTGSPAVLLRGPSCTRAPDEGSRFTESLGRCLWSASRSNQEVPDHVWLKYSFFSTAGAGEILSFQLPCICLGFLSHPQLLHERAINLRKCLRVGSLRLLFHLHRLLPHSNFGLARCLLRQPRVEQPLSEGSFVCERWERRRGRTPGPSC